MRLSVSFLFGLFWFAKKNPQKDENTPERCTTIPRSGIWWSSSSPPWPAHIFHALEARACSNAQYAQMGSKPSISNRQWRYPSRGRQGHPGGLAASFDAWHTPTQLAGRRWWGRRRGKKSIQPLAKVRHKVVLSGGKLILCTRLIPYNFSTPQKGAGRYFPPPEKELQKPGRMKG